MIERLSVPDQALFATVEGRQPYFYKYPTPTVCVKYADTVTNVLSNGCNATWYVDSENWIDTAYEGVVPIIKFWYGEGVPDTFVSENAVEDWGVKFSGFFRAPYTSKYDFYFGGEGIVSEFKINGVSFLTSEKYLSLSDTDYASSYSGIAFTSGNWYSFELKYKSRQLNGYNSGIISFWQTDDMNVTPEKIPLSAAVLSTGNPGNGNLPISLSTVLGIGKTQLSINSNYESTFTFEVPLVSSSDPYSYNGYFYDENNELFQNISNDMQIKKYRMIEYSEGYKNSSGVYQYIKRFTGQIRDFNIKYSKDGKDILQITCVDYSVFTKDSINLVSPTPLDYIQAGYLTEVKYRVNGVSKPRAFDGWELYKAYLVLLTNSFIDPFTFYQRKIHSGYHYDKIIGNYKIENINSFVDDWLDTKDYYGNPNIILGDEAKADDEYLYKIDTGEYYKDAIDNLMKSWYYKWGFDENAHPFLYGIDVPYSYVNDRDFDTACASGAWDKKTNIHCFVGTYNLAPAGGLCLASADVTGKKMDILFRVGPVYGSSDGTETVNISLRHNDVEFNYGDYSLYNSTTWSYYKGIDPSINLNPSVITLYGLRYDDYRLRIRTVNYNYPIALDGVIVYDEDYSHPSESFYTGDVHTSGSILDLQVGLQIDDQRSDCVVLGSRTGTKMGRGEAYQKDVVNPNNPIYQYIQSSSRDLNSVYKPTSINYIGHPRMTLIFDPSINSQEHADFVSYNVISEYNNPNKSLDFSIAGHPKIEIDDCISVNDDAKNVVNTTNYVWITDITNTFDSKNFISKISTSPVKPVNAFWKKPSPDLSEYDNHPIQNFKLYYNGAITSLSLDLSKTETNNITFRDNLSYHIPPKGYLKMINGEIIKYSSAAGWYVADLIRGIYTSHTTEAYFNELVNLAYDPYTQESMNVSPVIEFDCLVSGDIQIRIFSVKSENDSSGVKLLGSMHVDTLTGISKDGYPDWGFDKMTWGAGKRYTWGAFDQIGAYNNYVSNFDIMGGNYVVENMKLNETNSNRSLEFGKFYVEIDVISPKIDFTYRSDQPYSLAYPHEKYIYTRRGPVSEIDFWLDTAGMKRWATFTSTVTGATTYPADTARGIVIQDGVSRNLMYYNPSYIHNSANNYQGLKFWIKDNTVGSTQDGDLYRYVAPNIKYHILTYAGIVNKNNVVKYVEIYDNNDWLFANLENSYMNFKNPKSFYFNLKATRKGGNILNFVPSNILRTWIEEYGSGANNNGRLLVCPIILFSGEFVDRSGRPMAQTNKYLKRKTAFGQSIPNGQVYGTGPENHGVYEWMEGQEKKGDPNVIRLVGRWELTHSNKPDDGSLQVEMDFRKCYVHWWDEMVVGSGNIARPSLWKTKYGNVTIDYYPGNNWDWHLVGLEMEKQYGNTKTFTISNPSFPRMLFIFGGGYPS